MDFLNKAKETLNKGIEASSKAFSKAKDTAKDLGDKGVIRVEIMQLQKKEEVLIKELGELTYELLQVEGKGSISAKTAGIKEKIDDLVTAKDAIRKRKEELNEHESEAEKDVTGSTKSSGEGESAPGE